MKSGAVDAVLNGKPWVTRMTNAGTGKAVSFYVVELNRTEPVIFYAASRAWMEKNPELIKNSARLSKRVRRSSTLTGQGGCRNLEVHQAAGRDSSPESGREAPQG